MPEQQASQLPGLSQALCSEQVKAQKTNFDFLYLQLPARESFRFVF
jgi:hypothetical protein